MYTSKRLTDVYKSSSNIVFDNSSKLIFFSDCHRGDNSWADDFAPNRTIYLHALRYYYQQGYTYIEVGDGDELWKNRDFSRIAQAHSEVFELLKNYHNEGRLYMIFGNHDMIKKDPRFIQKRMHQCYNSTTGLYEPLLPDLVIHEGLVLKYKDSGKTLFVTHGHQGDLLNDKLWLFARFLVRYIWRQLEMLGFHNIVSPAGNIKRISIIERRVMEWAAANHQPILMGHTHTPMFPRPGRSPYFNTGSCVNAGYITGIEISNSEIQLVKWCITSGEDGTLSIVREAISGPQKLEDFFNNL